MWNSYCYNNILNKLSTVRICSYFLIDLQNDPNKLIFFTYRETIALPTFYRLFLLLQFHNFSSNRGINFQSISCQESCFVRLIGPSLNSAVLLNLNRINLFYLKYQFVKIHFCFS